MRLAGRDLAHYLIAMILHRALFAAIAAALRLAVVLALTVALLVPHIASAAKDHDPLMTMSPARAALMLDHSGTAHGAFGGIACAVVCFGAPVSDNPGLPTRMLRTTIAPYSVFLTAAHDAAAPDPALRPPDEFRHV